MSTRRPAMPDRRSGCPISTALEIFGDRWSLLIIRDLMFKGLHSFREFAAAGEGVATNVLAERLQRLEAAGLISHRVDREDRRRLVYRLTEKGLALAPVLIEMVLWSARYETTDAPPAVVRAMTRDREGVLRDLRRRWRRNA